MLLHGELSVVRCPSLMRIVVVGGGIFGATSAYELRVHNLVFFVASSLDPTPLLLSHGLSSRVIRNSSCVVPWPRSGANRARWDSS